VAEAEEETEVNPLLKKKKRAIKLSITRFVISLAMANGLSKTRLQRDSN